MTNLPLSITRCLCGRDIDPYEAFEVDGDLTCKECCLQLDVRIETCGDCGTEFLRGEKCPACWREVVREAA